jgi:hypothetical protein
VCNGQVVRVVVVIWTRTYLCVACKTVMPCITLLWILCYLSMLEWLSILYDYEMLLYVVPCYTCYVCNLVPIHFITLFCHLITHIFLGTPRFTKLYKWALTFLLVWIVCCSSHAYLRGGGSLYQVGKQNSIMLNCWKTLSVCHQSQKGGDWKCI